eukprot:CAMPEP_0194243170 /NCGR_PEP_ID=MMETSP0158-20130606/8469_1 /TAXON_ID=33649 /ORGANISM="Thalassionema nitzschioides, Strain L26-B" /LENGTH=140 /DNA_ID=CAMNT_0038978397 /DNA_START=76 /DNA_END=498 /DNA_ORIENTATION=-
MGRYRNGHYYGSSDEGSSEDSIYNADDRDEDGDGGDMTKDDLFGPVSRIRDLLERTERMHQRLNGLESELEERMYEMKKRRKAQEERRAGRSTRGRSREDSNSKKVTWRRTSASPSPRLEKKIPFADEPEEPDHTKEFYV